MADLTSRDPVTGRRLDVLFLQMCQQLLAHPIDLTLLLIHAHGQKRRPASGPRGGALVTAGRNPWRLRSG